MQRAAQLFLKYLIQLQMTCQVRAWKKGKQTLFSSISYCFFVSISFPNRLPEPRHSKTPHQDDSCLGSCKLHENPLVFIGSPHAQPVSLPQAKGQKSSCCLVHLKNITQEPEDHTQDAVGDIGLQALLSGEETSYL